MLIQRLRHIFRAIKQKDEVHKWTDKLRIVEAFTIKGVTYYQVDDVFSLPIERAFAANDVYAELAQRCTREYLLAHTAAVEAEMSNKRINITTIAQLNNNLKERLELIVDCDLIYKLASVVFFDKTENPYRYDYKYGLQKAAIFKQSPIHDFFFQTPLKTYIPLTDISQEDLDIYRKVGSQMTEHHLKYLSEVLSNNSLTIDLSKEYALRGIAV